MFQKKCGKTLPLSALQPGNLNLGLHHTMQMTYHLSMLTTKPPLQVGGWREAKSGEVFSRLEGGGTRPPLQVGGRRMAKSGEVFSRLEGGGRRADNKIIFYFPLGTPGFWRVFLSSNYARVEAREFEI